MRARVLFSLVGALIAAVALVSASGAATTKAQKVTRIDVSTRAAVIHYLRSIHINPKGVVIQRGLRNYAGAHCPGTRWTCASTRHTVVQIAKRSGQNRFLCRSSRCAVVQFVGVSHGVYTRRRLASTAASGKGGGNSGVCIKTTGLGASCSITQSSASANPNTAVVYENAGKQSGLTQTALYTATITQQATGATNGNMACVTQNINIDGSTTAKKGVPVTVTLEAHQSVTIKQDVLGSGANSAQWAATASGTCLTNPSPTDPQNLSQSQMLTSTANGSGPITQNEDDQFIACGDNVAGDYANLCLDIEQNQGSGKGVASGTNNATFTQSSTQTAVANTSAGPSCASLTTGVCVSQTQSSICTDNTNAPSDCLAPGGLVGTVSQDSTGQSIAAPTQNETQCEDAHPPTANSATSCDSVADAPTNYTLAQAQYGPEGVVGKPWSRHHRGRRLYGHLKGLLGTATQTGNNSDTYTIVQNSTQNDDLGGNTQQNFGRADCSTPGSCSVNQNQNINGTPSSNTQTGQDVNTQTSCSGSSCTSTGPSLAFSPTGLSVSNADVAEFGVGGMRGNGTGSITLSGITGPVGAAVLYWNGPTNSTDPNSNASVTFNGTAITGTNIGTANNNCWGFTNSQSYRADVTPLVTGNGTYSLTNFMKAGPPAVDINGVSLIVFYNDGNASNDRNFYAWNGNDSNIQFGTDPGGWNETISGVQYPGSGSAGLDTVVSDGQTFDDPALVLNGTNTLAADGPIFQGTSVPPTVSGGNLWDVEPFDITSFLAAGSNTLNVTSADPTTLGPPPNTAGWDCLSLVVAAANVPVSVIP
jgi:hypothetical protein